MIRKEPENVTWGLPTCDRKLEIAWLSNPKTVNSLERVLKVIF